MLKAFQTIRSRPPQGLALLVGLALSGSLLADEESQNIFAKLDQNGDGIVVAEEVGEEQSRFFERLLRVGDANEDGKLSKGEYESAIAENDSPVNPAARGPMGDRGRGFRPDPAVMFQRLDQNKDGKLTKEELPDGMKDRIAPLFERLGKEELTQDDFAKMFTQGRRGDGRPGEGRPDMMAFLKRMDSNQDGKLSRDEIPEQMRERMGAMFDRLGKDEVSFDELEKYRAERERRDGAARPEEMRRPQNRAPRDAEQVRGPREGDRSRDGASREEGRPRDGMGRPPMGERRPFAFMAELDGNRDGQLDKEELSKASELLNKLDRNNDGKLSPPELMGFGPPPRDGDRPEGGRPPGDRPEMRRDGDQPPGRGGFGPEQLLERMDTDKNGSISKDEAPGRMKENFDNVDTNGDGSLSKEELQEMMERFRNRRPE